MRFIELPIEYDPDNRDAQRFNWRSRKGLIKIHRHWALSREQQKFYFDGPEIVTVDEEEPPLDWTRVFANHYGLWSTP